MIVGNPLIFAIESGITNAYECLGVRALGFFVIHVGGRSYGVCAPDATCLACSFGEVEDRIADRGSHITPFADQDAGAIADAFRSAIYADQQEKSYFGLPLDEFCNVINSRQLVWAPDGDEAFDDSSYVLQLDVGDRVRLIAFKSRRNYVHEPGTLSDVWLTADDFYGILRRWHDAFESEWAAMPKTKES